MSYEKLIPMIRDLSDFRLPEPIRANPAKRDHSKKCAYHKEHRHTMEQCRSLHYLVERLIKAGHLKQYVRLETRVGILLEVTTPGPPRPQSPLEALTDRNAHPIDGTIIFPSVDPTRILQPHRDAIILSLGIGDFDVRRILVDPGSSADLLQASVIKQMRLELSGLENPGRILSGFNGAATTSLRDVKFSVVEDLSPFNAILGRTWLHYMKVIPSTYHQMVSFLTEDGRIDLYGSQLIAHQYYQIA
ncbi:hypothetical protein CK203_008641 [Vitis vinifera]|uniref:Peptidase A2 domain-containing protein n=1 Tax=Vitis vinifera TaxID=29760 RepID=A0A438KD12_VITVI|nr:hypothetical protein CK203_008641 [Vitis vinifera]